MGKPNEVRKRTSSFMQTYHLGTRILKYASKMKRPFSSYLELSPLIPTLWQRGEKRRTKFELGESSRK